MKTAFISVFDKSKIFNFAQFLINHNYKIISTGGTFKYLLENGLNPINVKEVTQFPEILDGRVKTLHPKIHGGILAKRENFNHMKTIKNHNINMIDMVIVNLYPFFKNARKNLSLEEKIEFIDIGGSSLLRSAGKSFCYVTVICDISDYKLIQNEINENVEISFQTRKKLAGKVFNFTAAYDAAISKMFLGNNFPDYFTTSYKKVNNLRYGENPHQKASYYVDTIEKGIMQNFEQFGGKELSFNNIRDIDLAWKVVSEFKNEFSCCSLKHSTPCGVSLGENSLDTYKKTLECDPISIFGGIVAMNYCIDLATAQELNKTFLEIVVATSFENNAIEELKKKKNLRIIQINEKLNNKLQFIKVDGGLLVQEVDEKFSNNFTVVTNLKPTENQLINLIFAQKVCKFVKSNAIVVASKKQTFGISGGKVNRIWAAEHALKEARKKFYGEIILASDAFFPFRDVVDLAIKFGVVAIIQPGGSVKDKEIIQVCNQNNIAMVFTGMRHFLH